MNIVERPIDELTDYWQARRHVVDVVLDTLPEAVLEHSILSGFEAKDCLNGEVYEPTSETIKSGELYAASPNDRFYLSWVGHYAAQSFEPAVGVYDARMFRVFNGVGYVVNSGLTVVEACTDIFVWR